MAHLFSTIECFGKNSAIVCHDGSLINYDELALKADEVAKELGISGLLALEASAEPETLFALIGACRANCPVMILAPGDLKTKPHIKEEFKPEYLFVAGQEARGIQRSDFYWDRLVTNVHPELALLFSTSGSTGSAKFVRLSHLNLISNADSIIEYLQLDENSRAISTLPFHYSFGFSILTSYLRCGASIVLSKYSVLDEELWKQIAQHQVTSLSGVPHTYELFSQNGFFDRELPSLKTLTQAGGKLSPELVALFAENSISRGRRFFVMYGQTEASPRISYLPPELALKNADTIGIPVPGGSIHLIDSDGIEIENSDTLGELVYCGPNVMMGYATSRSHLEEGSGLQTLKTGDIAHRKANGLYKIVGRASRFVKLAGLRIGLDEVEGILKGYGYNCLATGNDTLLAIAIEGRKQEDIAAIARQLNDELKVPANSIHVSVYETLPMLPSGKPDYMTVLFRAKDSLATTCNDLYQTLCQLLNRKSLGDEECFNTAGGDSLNYIEGSILVERHFGRAVPGWEQLPFSKLLAFNPRENPLDEPSSQAPVDTLLVARSFSVLLAMLSHSFMQFGVWLHLPDYFRLVTRCATPAFFIIFGMGVARTYFQKSESSDLDLLKKRFFPKAFTIYLALVLTQLCAFIGQKEDLLHTLSSIIFNSNGRFIDILAIYYALYLCMPMIVRLLASERLWGFWGLIAIPWALWPMLHSVENNRYLFGFLLGAGSIVGPSVLHSITFCLFGYSLSAWIRHQKMRFETIALIMVFIGALVTFIASNGVDAFVVGISDMSLRRASHPVFFAFGILGALIILGISTAVVRFINDSENVRLALGLGANSIFAFTFGNMILNLGPGKNLSLAFGLVVSFIFVAGLTLLTYDISLTQPRLFGPISRVLQAGFFRIMRVSTKKVAPFSQ